MTGGCSRWSPEPARSSPSMSWSRRVRPRSLISTTAARGPPRGRRVRPQRPPGRRAARAERAAVGGHPPRLCTPAKTRGGAPEELRRPRVEAGSGARGPPNARTRLKAAAFPVTKTLDQFDLGVSSVPKATFAYLASLEWITARENLCLVGPAGAGNSHLLGALGVAAVQAGQTVRYFPHAELP